MKDKVVRGTKTIIRYPDGHMTIMEWIKQNGVWKHKIRYQ